LLILQKLDSILDRLTCAIYQSGSARQCLGSQGELRILVRINELTTNPLRGTPELPPSKRLQRKSTNLASCKPRNNTFSGNDSYGLVMAPNPHYASRSRMVWQGQCEVAVSFVQRDHGGGHWIASLNGQAIVSFH
jgi:hypothetical protein